MYEGQFYDNNMHGKGVMVWPDGTRFEGDYIEGKINGKGTK